MNSIIRIRKIYPGIVFSILVVGILYQVACLIPNNKNLHVIVHLERKDLSQSSLLVFNFREPLHAKGFGEYIAERFHVNLLEAKAFNVVGLQGNSSWDRLGETEESRLLNALEECRDKHFDYIMVGEIKDYYDGGINRSRLGIKVRIIEVATRVTVFLAENALNDQGKDPSYPMTTKLSTPSSSPKILAEKLIKEFIKVLTPISLIP